ncbi:hypothetical protein Prum_038990 [Phytohabitans rumicis]|uniref:Uncharacterized protein n=2 Tax=Phytohabitans rumicis TaxID=1076125 RepID=A0A6V8L8C8_9ACTN|nr:hypothetical protein Prum_038990 [Phytohabitans rumicis]
MDPIEAMNAFLARITAHDPEPDTTVMSLQVQVGRARETLQLSARAVHALTEALTRYVDPDDHGTCANCGKPLSKDLYCPGCGHVDGIFGQTVANHAATVLRQADRTDAT